MDFREIALRVSTDAVVCVFAGSPDGRLDGDG
jgi:hypothetical protein